MAPTIMLRRKKDVTAPRSFSSSPSRAPPPTGSSSSSKVSVCIAVVAAAVLIYTGTMKSVLSDRFMPSFSFSSTTSSTSSGSAIVGDSIGRYPKEPFWWLEDTEDDWFERQFEVGVAKPRDISYTKKRFNPSCGHYRFDESKLPQVSVIITSQNEVPGWMAIAVHSILARTPPKLLKEIILVDDNGLPPEIRYADGAQTSDEEFQELSKLPKVKLIQNHDKEGCGRSRLIGARAATAEVLMFVDSHIEMMSSTWYHHLMVPIMENPHTSAVQFIDLIHDDGTKSYRNSTGGSNLGILKPHFSFGWKPERFEHWNGNSRETTSLREHYETPIGPGSLFAIRADEFWRLGGYDEGLYVWGAENIELALKSWMCGGRLVMVPCSRVGHMFRVNEERKKKEWPPKISNTLVQKLGFVKKVDSPVKDSGYNATAAFEAAKSKFKIKGKPARSWFSQVLIRNNIRVMEIWVGDHPAKKKYYELSLGNNGTLDSDWQEFKDELQTDPAAQKQLRLKKENKCRNFEWFDKHVYTRLIGRHVPWYYTKEQEKEYEQIMAKKRPNKAKAPKTAAKPPPRRAVPAAKKGQRRSL